MSSIEKVANVNCEFSLSENKPSSNSDDVSRFKRMMGFTRQVVDLGRPFDGGGGGSGGGPNNCNSGGATEAVGHMYGAGVSSFRFGGENLATSTPNLQPFDIFADAYSVFSLCTSLFFRKRGVRFIAAEKINKCSFDWLFLSSLLRLRVSAEEMAAVTAAFPFTFAQWKELERQAMIYKYMTSSVPVPPDLLFPHSRNYSVAPLHSPASLYNARYSRNGDPEPGRCKRTDGKKWRCSRDVAPHQKYCERHLHRGRPRSRKPVEVKNNGETLKITRIEPSHVPYSSPSSQHFTAGNDKQPLLLNAKNDMRVSASSSYREPKRDLSFMMEETDQQLQHLFEANMGLANVGSSYGSNNFFHQDYAEQQSLNLLSYSNFPAPETDPLPSGFIDAWSINNLDCSNSENTESSITMNHDNLSPSLNLSIAMAAGSIVDQEMGSLECCNQQIAKESRWSIPAFWEPFAPGGPLAEALQLGSFAISKNPAPHSISAPATTVSSPTGVLHRTLFPHSDGSICNSPTRAALTSEIAHSDGSICNSPTRAALTSEIAFHRLN